MHLSSPARVLAAAAAAALVLAACGTDSDGDDAAATTSAAPTTQAAAFPVTVASDQATGDTEITINDEPTAVISLSPTATEMLWAVGAGDQVVAVDDQSNYPDDVPVTDLSGFEPNIEAILSYSPDLVMVADDTGDLSASLAAADVPTLVLPAANDLSEAYEQVERIGAATGNVEEAAEVVSQMQTDLDAIVADAPADAEGLAYFHELDPTLYTVTGETFVGQVYGLFGLESIGDAAGDDLYPQLSEEFVVEADPDVIFLADTECCGVTEEAVAERAGWQTLTAVERGSIVPVDADVASRWGPRIVDFAASVSDALVDVTAAAATG